MSDSLERLHKSVVALQKGDPALSRTARLMRSGRAKIAKKMAEEATELFQKITADYKGTPWAIQAKQEKSVAIGLNWKPA